MYAAGNTLAILEVSTMKRRVVFGLDGGGVGCFAVHPSGTLVAVGDKGSMPNIYVYEYPSFKIAKVKGACHYTSIRWGQRAGRLIKHQRKSDEDCSKLLDNLSDVRCRCGKA